MERYSTCPTCQNVYDYHAINCSKCGVMTIQRIEP